MGTRKPGCNLGHFKLNIFSNANFDQQYLQHLHNNSETNFESRTFTNETILSWMH